MRIPIIGGIGIALGFFWFWITDILLSVLTNMADGDIREVAIRVGLVSGVLAMRFFIFLQKPTPEEIQILARHRAH